MIRMISSANFKNSDAKTNLPANSGEQETDDFAALLDGMSFVIPPVVQQPVNLSANLSPENKGENSIDLQAFDGFGDGAQPLPQFDGSAIPNESASNSPENLFGQIADTGEGNIENINLLPKSFETKLEIPPAETTVESTVQLQESNAAQNALSAKTDVQDVENTGERNSSVSSDKNLFDQIESVQTENNSTESGKSVFKISENQMRQEMFGGEGKSETPNKLPKLFREVSSFFEVSDLAMKNQPQIAGTAAPVSTESVKVAAQIEPQIAQMIAMAIKTEKPQILKMRLNPAELGGVEIKIEKDAAGKISAHFTTEKEETRKILTENMTQLRDSLQDSGWQIERVEVSCDSFSFGGNEARENSSQANENVAFNSFAHGNDASGLANTQEDLNSEKSDRLLSVRA